MAGIGIALAVGMGLGAPASNAQQSLFIQGPDGGDCARLGGTWKASTCTLGALDVQQGQTLTIRRGATVYVVAQFVNFGTVVVRSNFLLGKNMSGGGFVNYGHIDIRPEAGLAGAPGLHNHFGGTNFGVISNRGRYGNYKTLSNVGQIGNVGDLYNGVRGRIEMTGRGLLNNQAGTLRNSGVIVGRVVGPCPGQCFNRARARKSAAFGRR